MRSAVNGALAAAAAAKLAPLLAVQEEELEALPHLDVLWHYECVVSPRSPAAAAAKPHDSPRFNDADANYIVEDSQAGSSAMVAGSSCEGLGIMNESGVEVGMSAHEASIRKDVERQALQRVFNTFDEDGDGRVSVQELGRIFERLGISKSQESIESLLADSTGLVSKAQGHVDEEEFALLYESACCQQLFDDGEGSSSDLHADVDGDLRAAFHVFDKDHNGFISPTELQSVLCGLGFPQAKELEACVEMIARVDENGDGQVDFFEFKKLLGLEDPLIILSC